MKSCLLVLFGIIIGTFITTLFLGADIESTNESIQLQNNPVAYNHGFIDLDDKRTRASPFNVDTPKVFSSITSTSGEGENLPRLNDYLSDELNEGQSLINKSKLKEYLLELGLFSPNEIIEQNNIESYLIEHYLDNSETLSNRLDSLNYAALSNKDLIDGAIVQSLLDETELMDEATQSDDIVKSLAIVNGALEPQNIFQMEKYLDFDDPAIRKVAIQAIAHADNSLMFRDKLFDIWKHDKNSDIRNDVYFILSERYGFTAEHFDL